VGPYLTTVKHRYTHFSVELHTYHCFLRAVRRSRSEGAKWVTIEEVEKLAMPKANLRILDEMRRTGRPLALISR
jgi:adenine-specific DNA glycosylase